MYQIRINAIDGGGYEMQVGCQRFFYGTHAAMVAELNNYLEKPQKTEAQYNRFKAQLSDAKDVNPLRTTFGAGGMLSPGTLSPAQPGFTYQEPIHELRFNHNPSTFTGPSTGEIRSADSMRNMAGAIRP